MSIININIYDANRGCVCNYIAYARGPAGLIVMVRALVEGPSPFIT